MLWGGLQHGSSLKEMDMGLGFGDRAMNLSQVKVPKQAFQTAMGWNGNLNVTKKQQGISRVGFILK